jgi:biopolymer transport protein ExbD
MSHGASEKAEPNFIPLLDLVLQLVMFFMITANFVLEQTDVTIKLPKALAAQTIKKTDDYVIYLNVNEQGKVLLPSTERYKDSAGKETESLDNPIQVESYLKRKAKEDEGRAGPANKDQAARSVIILRVDERCRFEKTYGIMKACRAAGYQRVQLRAILAGSS